MALTTELSIPSYPARPVKGGDLALAGPKVGRWFVEPKYNGWRALVHVPSGTMFNRHGKRLTIENEFETALSLLRCTGVPNDWLDCEALERRHGIGRGTLIVLDYIPDVAWRGALVNYEDRRASLDGFYDPKCHLPILDPASQPENSRVYLAPNFEQDIAQPLWAELQALNRHWKTTGLNEFYEGIVMKRADSLYPLQLRSPDTETPHWMKHRHTAA